VITVGGDGRIQANVASWDAFAIHHQAKISSVVQPTSYQRTVVFIQAQTQSGQDMFIRGGLDHTTAASRLGISCTSSNYLCALPIRHRNLKNTTTAPWKANDAYLDWYGREANQSTSAEGTALDWTTNLWPASWGTTRTVAVDGYGVEALNRFGAHYWMLDVDMDCSKTINGWFELKAFVKNGQGWEANIAQTGTPYASQNHMAQCGKLNVFTFGQSSALIEALP
jgi:alpha-amylase